MLKTFASFAFGCRVNEAEKIVMDKKMIAAGIKYDDAKPDIFIINSCAVTAKAEHEVRQLVNQTRKKFPDTRIIVTGCAATQWIKTKQKINGVDQLIANNQKNEIVRLFEQSNYFSEDKSAKTAEFGQKKKDDNLLTGPAAFNETSSTPLVPDKFTRSGRFTVKIQDGCNRFCSYCIVPYLRGKPRSRKIDEIIGEINGYDQIAKEVILTAINTEFFGIGAGETLPELLKEILKKTNIERLSLGSIHPWSINAELIDWYEKNSGNDRFVHFFHIPIQSGSDKILKLMHRGYTAEEMMDKLNRIQKINPKALIGTDVIVGFPGESENEFRETYDFLKNSPVSKFHIFRYSPRIGTQSIQFEKLNKSVSPADKIIRAEKLADLGKKKYEKFLKSLIGLSGKAQMLRDYQNGYQSALFINQIPVLIKSGQILNLGTIENILIGSATGNSVYASLKLD
jgi:threonylcarbamoyladenosine tRNA methylthiotransferase MtaB